MGLCKCPKRQVTNQFCFEHRVNVCEHCMVQNHPKCVVQSYLQWLKDSDYVSNCTLCDTTLEQGECIRLICYHVFHWECLNSRQAALPQNTAPHGHCCPTCEKEIFPTSNLVSPVADALKAYLSKVNWGRNGLGLTLLSEDISINRSNSMGSSANIVKGRSSTAGTINSVTKVHHSGAERSKADRIFGNSTSKQDSPHSILLIDAFNPSSSSDTHSSSRRPLLPRQSPIGGSDRDDNKYKRRTPAEILSRWSRRFYAPSSRPPWRRTWFLVLSGVFAFVFLIYLIAAIGRSDSNDNDEWNNPNPNPNQNMHYE